MRTFKKILIGALFINKSIKLKNCENQKSKARSGYARNKKVT